MKRVRISTGEVSHIQTQYSGSSFADLPKDIVMNILIRLSVKRILISKCVCKTWYGLISDPEFGKLHFDRGEVYPLIRRHHCKEVYLVQPDKDDFEVKLGMCDHTHSKSGCVCNVQVKLDTKFEMLPEYGYREYSIGTCNGLICVSNPFDKRLCPVIVCNPITDEFISLPKAKNIGFNGQNIRYGLGFSPPTNQYKVLRMSQNKVAEAYIHILGTKTWKNIGSFTQSMPKLSPTYLNGFLYWSNHLQPLSICTFDVEKESFGSVSAPTVNQPYQYHSVGVLGGDLCMCGVLESGDIHVWTMKNNGIRKEWSKVFSFDPIYVDGKRNYGPWLPIKYLNDGALLMFYSPHDAFVYMDPKKNRFRYLKVRQFNIISKPEAFAYIPSFISLKHALSGCKAIAIAKMLNVESRCSKLRWDTKIEIVEEEFHAD